MAGGEAVDMGVPQQWAGRRNGRLVAVKRLPGRPAKLKCNCDCGKNHTVWVCNFTHTFSCGCLRDEYSSARRRVDLTGKRFGKLTAIRNTWRLRHSNYIWECLCDCGNVAYVTTNDLGSRGKNGIPNTKSCGCNTWRNIAGQRFGRLVAVKITDRDRRHGIVWECLCDCGNRMYQTAAALLAKRDTGSCGCVRRTKTGGIAEVDLVGHQFGWLTVAEKAHLTNQGQMWKCKCRCGKYTFVKTGDINRKHTRSCGCFQDAFQMTRGTSLPPEKMPKELLCCWQTQRKIRRMLQE